MLIKNHKLYLDKNTPVQFNKTPNCGGNYTDLKYLCYHYTSGPSLEGAVNTLCNPARKASAHLILERDGKIAQLVPFNIKSWHAGTSEYKGLVGLNSYSIGIEIVNWGMLTKTEAGKWISWSGKQIPDDQVIVAKPTNGGSPKGWQTYTEKQLEALEDISELLIKTYNLEDIITHEMISPGRKFDTGPAFPFTSFKSRLFGRHE
jgi:N-acetylmuramoyl-L-alanine amidase